MLTQEDLQAIAALIKAEGNRLDGKVSQLDGKVSQLDGKVSQLDGKVSQLDGKIGTEISRLELKIELMHESNKKEHAEIMEKLTESNEINGHEVKALEKRVDVLEEHTGLTKPHKN